MIAMLAAMTTVTKVKLVIQGIGVGSGLYTTSRKVQN